MNTQDIKLCVACRHHQDEDEFHGFRNVCTRSQLDRADLIEGRDISKLGPELCDKERYSTLSWRCGPEGKFWEPAE